MAENKEQVANTVYEIVMHARRIKGENEQGKKYDFLAYEATDTNGCKAKFKFTKDVTQSGILPKEAGEYLFKIDKRFINKDHKTRFNEYWVRAVASVEPYVPSFADNTEDLPF